jgi:hypothetical protein
MFDDMLPEKNSVNSDFLYLDFFFLLFLTSNTLISPNSVAIAIRA